MSVRKLVNQIARAPRRVSNECGGPAAQRSLLCEPKQHVKHNNVQMGNRCVINLCSGDEHPNPEIAQPLTREEVTE